MRIALLGLGLIGGSIARALRIAGPASSRDMPGVAPSTQSGQALTIVGWSPSGRSAREALEDGVLDDVPLRLEGAVDAADLVVICAPPLACLELLDRLAALRGGPLAELATVTDVASTKTLIVRRADACGLPFVGGHPMAGRETSGYGSGSADLFVGRPWVIVPGSGARPRDVERVESLATACGAMPIHLGAAEHDAATAAISHAPLIVAAALAAAVTGADAEELGVEWAVAAKLAASGWRDTTRLARGDPAMGAGIAATNSAATARVLRLIQAELESWISELERGGSDGPDPERLLARLDAVRERLTR